MIVHNVTDQIQMIKVNFIVSSIIFKWILKLSKRRYYLYLLLLILSTCRTTVTMSAIGPHMSIHLPI